MLLQIKQHVVVYNCHFDQRKRNKNSRRSNRQCRVSISDALVRVHKRKRFVEPPFLHPCGACATQLSTPPFKFRSMRRRMTVCKLLLSGYDFSIANVPCYNWFTSQRSLAQVRLLIQSRELPVCFKIKVLKQFRSIDNETRLHLYCSLACVSPYQFHILTV